MWFDSNEEVFFDSLDFLPSQGSFDVSEESLGSDLGFSIWLNEPQNVRERRKNFLHKMGFVDSATSHEQVISLDSETMRMEKSGAVSSCSSSLLHTTVENAINNGSELSGEANCCIEHLVQDLHSGPSPTSQVVMKNTSLDLGLDKNKLMKWWRRLINKSEKSQDTKDILKENRSVKVRHNKKRNIELSDVSQGQEIFAHWGLIWSMKFSPDGQFLASGGEDGVVRVWFVNMLRASNEALYAQGEPRSRKDKLNYPKIVIPEKIFHLQEFPFQQFYGHTADVLDLAWSKSNCLLSSSKDKTVRLWQMGCDECLHVFQHNDYVTCVQFNPCNENYFLSGSIDGKVRYWGMYERRVIDWADVRDVITAICYHPDGKGFLAGSVTGTCSFFDTSDGNFVLNARVHFRGRKKSSGNKITGIQITREDSRRVIISFEDSKIRILEGTEVVKKYRGLVRSGSQMSASITSSGRHIISVGEDSRVYMWNYDEFTVPSFKRIPSSRSCEHFFSKGVSLVVPWSGMESKLIGRDYVSPCHHLTTQDALKASSSWRDSSCFFSLANWFSRDGSCRSSTTWPEEKLPSFDAEYNCYGEDKFFSRTWGLVIVTADRDGVIRTFHNYGLPISI